MTRHAAPEARKRAERRGRWSEWVAVLFLMAKGYRILALRYRVRAGEIDIIARRGALVAFVEVKARRDLMAAVDAVTFASQNRIRAAGDHWLPVSLMPRGCRCAMTSSRSRRGSCRAIIRARSSFALLSYRQRL